MAKKKATKKKTARPAVKKKVVKKKAVKKKVAVRAASKKNAAAKKRTGVKKKAVKKAARRKAASPKRKGPKLGRARVTGDAKLDQFFKRDYEARQVFEFLRVHTVRELEEYAPGQIVELLTAPMVKTVDRIRKALALNNRSLRGDQKYAFEFIQSLISGKGRKR